MLLETSNGFFKLGGFDKKLGIDRDHDRDRDRTIPVVDIFKMLKFYRLTIKPSQKIDQPVDFVFRSFFQDLKYFFDTDETIETLETG
jgi:hypothetical protein